MLVNIQQYPTILSVTEPKGELENHFKNILLSSLINISTFVESNKQSKVYLYPAVDYSKPKTITYLILVNPFLMIGHDVPRKNNSRSQ